MNSKLFSSERLPFLTTVILHSRISWSIRLRWLAVSGFFLATLSAKLLSEIEIQYHAIWILLAVLAAINLVYSIIFKWYKQISLGAELFILNLHIVLDLIFLTLLIHYSGGVESPVYLFYLFHVVLSSIIFPLWLPLVFATLVIVLFVGMIYAEYSGLITHYCIYSETWHNNFTPLVLLVAVFIVTVYVTAYICMTFMQIYRQSKRIIDIQNHKLIEADRQKTRFFQFASHELKSPIIATKSTIDGVLKSFSGSMDEKAVNLLNRSSMRAGQMLDIVRELLELSRKRSIPVEPELKVLELEPIVIEMFEQERGTAEARGIELHSQWAAGQANVLGQRNDYEKIFLNLINNAVRYTPDNGRVGVSTSIKNANVVVRVYDTGIGISPKDLERIYEEFYRSENAKKMVGFGTGLGLSLVKQLVDNMGGTIQVSSQLNEGTTFEVRFPAISRVASKRGAEQS